MSAYASGLSARNGARDGDPLPPEPASADSAREALRRVAAGVTVFTVNADGRRHGTTVSAVAAMSREPLILGGCLRRAGSFAEMVRGTGLFSVNVLAGTQSTLARRFADPDRPVGDAQFAGLPWFTDPRTGAPLIRGSLAHLACRTLRWHPVGDYDLLLAEVIGGEAGRGMPVLSFAGQLHSASVAPVHEPSPTIGTPTSEVS